MDILKRIAEYAKRDGKRIAFKSRKGEINYQQLWDISGRIACMIQDLMQDDKEPVIVYGHKDPLMIACFIACVRSGRAYCPVDVNTPTDRMRGIVEKIGNPLVVLVEGAGLSMGIEESKKFGGARWIVDNETISEVLKHEPSDVELVQCKGDDNFYIIFTSGTTGTPKGVQITSDNLNNYLKWAVTLAGGIEEHSYFLNQAPYSFDLSVMDLYLSLATGGTVISVDSELQKQSGELMKYLTENEINYWVSTPSFSSVCLAEKDFNGLNLPGIKSFLFCGEPLLNSTALELINRFPNSNVINTYGPTESTVCVTEIKIDAEMASRSEPLPVGKVKEGSEIILDEKTSEIIIIGDTVSPGYYKEPDLNSNSFFIVDLLLHGKDAGVASTYKSPAIARAYRTGDKGHFGSDGLLYCDGRLDNQIKLHGYRMELEDIESNLEKIPGVIRGTVAARWTFGRADYLTAFIIRDETLIEGDYLGRKRIREAMRKVMPSYMVPKRVIFVDELPMTVNGKLDRNKLKEMA